MDGTHQRTIQKALALMEGSKSKLATALEIRVEDIDGYLAGDKPLPHDAFLSALDIVAGTNNGRTRTSS
jgi:hypothetical protein